MNASRLRSTPRRRQCPELLSQTARMDGPVRPVRAALAAALLSTSAAAAHATPLAGEGAGSPAVTARSASASPLAPPAAVARHLADARLAGEGLLRWFGLRVYEARLWTAAPAQDPQALLATGFALELRYARALDGGAIAAASHDEIARLGLGSPAQRAAWLEAMRGLFPDVSAGDRLTGVNLPGRGVAFYRDDRPLGRIDDPAFGPAFFSIWLHPDTAAPSLRQALLGRAATLGTDGR